MDNDGAIGQIAELFAAGGPYSMAAVLLWLYYKLWGKIDARDDTIKSQNEQLVRVTEANTRALTDFASSARELGAKIDKCPK